jgi:hypothetical protein
MPFGNNVRCGYIRELVRKGRLPVSALIEVGNDHRLADREPLPKK